MKTTIKDLNAILNEIAEKLNLATSKEEAIRMYKDKYLYIEYNSVYGGYRIVNVGVNNGAHYGAFGSNSTEARVKAPLMLARLDGILTGIQLMEDKALKGIKYPC